MQDFYTILGVPKNASTQQIRDRFRELARSRHPDRFSGEEKASAEEAFQAITQAFNVLVSPERRRQHDVELEKPSSDRVTSDADATRVYMQRGIKAYKAKNYLEAAENFDRATKKSPKDPRAWHHLALACSHQQRWMKRAVRAISTACDLSPMKVSYLKAAGKIHAAAGLASRAEHYYQQALQWGGEDPMVDAALAALNKGRSKKSRRPGLFGKI